MAVERRNPYGAYNFLVKVDIPTGVDLDQNAVASFMECSGLDNENAPIEYREGTDQPPGSGATAGATVRKLPGMERYPNVVLRRGIAGDTSLWKWRKALRDANHDERPVTTVRIALLNEHYEEGSPVMTWVLWNAWPTKLSGPTLNAKGNDLAIETLELACERIEIEG